MFSKQRTPIFEVIFGLIPDCVLSGVLVGHGVEDISHLAESAKVYITLPLVLLCFLLTTLLFTLFT